MNNKQLLSLSATAALFGHAAAFWRMECRGTTAQARIDPLVNPGTVADHAHQIFGSGGEFPCPKLKWHCASDMG